MRRFALAAVGAVLLSTLVGTPAYAADPVHDPIPTAGLSLDDIPALMRRTHEIVASGLGNPAARPGV